ARAILQQSGLNFSTHPATHDPQVPQGVVISQDVPPGSELPQGSVVTYTVSLGADQPKIVEIPDVTRQSFDTAKAQLENLGLQVQRQDQPNAPDAGFVFKQNPQAGLKVATGSTITLLVSLGDVVRFPNVIGLDRAQAEQIIKSTAGLTLRFVDEQG